MKKTTYKKSYFCYFFIDRVTRVEQRSMLILWFSLTCIFLNLLFPIKKRVRVLNKNEK